MFEKVTWSRVTQCLGLSKTYVEALVSLEAFLHPWVILLGPQACILGDVMGLSLQKADSGMKAGVQEVS